MSPPADEAADGGQYVPFPTFDRWAAERYDPSDFTRFEQLLEAAKEVADEQAVRRALETATRWAAVDTGAIEGLYEVDRGFTYSVAVEAALIESIRLEKGIEVARAVEDALTTYEGLLDMATKATPITEAWIRSVHASICASQETYTVYTLGADGESAVPQQRQLPKGQYKTESNSPWNRVSGQHAYAPPVDTGPEMQRLTAELGSDAFQSAHPVLQASYAHYAFVAVHPFADGNGRVARALASVFLYRRPGIPLVVFADQKSGYLDALEAADGGRYGAFTRYIGERAIDTIQMVRDSFTAAAAPDLKAQIAAISEMLTGRGDLEHEELDALAGRLLSEWAAALKEEIPTEKTAPIQIVQGQTPAGGSPPNERYRSVKNARGSQITAASRGPGASTVTRSYRVLVTRPGIEGADLIIARGKSAVTEVFIRDLHPSVSQSLQFRLRSLAKAEISGLLAELHRAVDDQLRSQGYR